MPGFILGMSTPDVCTKHDLVLIAASDNGGQTKMYWRMFRGWRLIGKTGELYSNKERRESFICTLLDGQSFWKGLLQKQKETRPYLSALLFRSPTSVDWLVSAAGLDRTAENTSEDASFPGGRARDCDTRLQKQYGEDNTLTANHA